MYVSWLATWCKQFHFINRLCFLGTCLMSGGCSRGMGVCLMTLNAVVHSHCHPFLRMAIKARLHLALHLLCAKVCGSAPSDEGCSSLEWLWPSLQHNMENLERQYSWSY